MKLTTRRPVLELLEARLALSASNLIVNGDFTQGNTGFLSQYSHTPGNIGGAQTYDVASRLNVIGYGDHTTGNGNMLAVNGSNLANVLVWSQSVAVVPNTDYQFSLWSSSWFPQAPSPLGIRFNDAQIGIAQAPSTVGQWREFTANWNSGNLTSLTLFIFNNEGADIGGDFALDDISLTSGGTTLPPDQGSGNSGGSPSVTVPDSPELGAAGLEISSRQQQMGPMMFWPSISINRSLYQQERTGLQLSPASFPRSDRVRPLSGPSHQFCLPVQTPTTSL